MLDVRGAYVTQLVLLAPGGPGPTELWVDRVTVYGAVRATMPLGHPTAPSGVDLAAAWTAGATGALEPLEATPRPPVPLVPRIIQWQGEPWPMLQELGFDGVWMGRPPNAGDLAEARRLNLWLVCPPPPLATLQSEGLGRRYDPVLAWDLGELAEGADVELVDQWSRELRRVDPVAGRPATIRAASLPRHASGLADVLLAGRPTVGATATWLEHSAWLSRQRRLAPPGAALWATIDTHASAAATAQLGVLAGGASPPAPATFQHLSQATVAALSVWPRGFVFQSESSLAAGDPQTRRRALALELTNLRLGMVEPWLAAGKAVTAARASRSDLSATVLTVERSPLAAPMWWDAVAPREDDQTTSLVMPGVPETCEAYVLSIADPRRAPTRRVTGGLYAEVGRVPQESFVLFTEDGFAYAQVERYLRRHAGRAAQLRVELAALERQAAAEAIAQLSESTLAAAEARQQLQRVDAALSAVHATLGQRDMAGAYARAAEADELLVALRSQLYGRAWPDGAAGSAPGSGEWATLPHLERATTAVAGSPQQPQIVPGGDFESLDGVQSAGWEHAQA
ncbi:MAG TPA: hypothetical protein PKC18_19960, partial [Lacipirellulaceae bacterium]|nr:hypothetical protein [Lacipirellulaceae bacterium]